MWQSDFQYYLAVESVDGESIGDVRLDVDWIPALRWAEFEQNVRNQRALNGCGTSPVIEPVWNPEREPPYVGGVTIRDYEPGAEATPFTLTYFSDAVTKASAELVASGALATGQPFEYKIYALAQAKPRDPVSWEIDIVALDELPPIQSVELAPLMADAEINTNIAVRRSSDRTPTMPIFIPQSVLDEATDLARNVGDIETGGILVGSLCRDPDGTLYSKVTAQIPAEHTTATRESLRFHHATWVSVDAAIRLRNLGEIPLGWWHAHPFFCEHCPSERRSLCPFSIPKFSVADRGVHREVFQKSWSVALLLSFLGAEQPSYDLFGWNQGQIEAMPFITLPDRAAIKENH